MSEDVKDDFKSFITKWNKLLHPFCIPMARRNALRETSFLFLKKKYGMDDITQALMNITGATKLHNSDWFNIDKFLEEETFCKVREYYYNGTGVDFTNYNFEYIELVNGELEHRKVKQAWEM